MDTKVESTCCVWDFTLWVERHGIKRELSQMKSFLNTIAKKWTFQLELSGENKLEHYQGRFSLKVGTRRPQVEQLFEKEFEGGFHTNKTAKINMNNTFYVMKEDTRISGPWSDTDPQETYHPRHIRKVEGNWYPWQKSIIADCEKIDDDIINVVIDINGLNGKTSLVHYIDIIGLGLVVPPLNDYKQLMEYCMSFTPRRAYLIDMPRAIGKDHLYQFFSAIETIKGGFMFNTRYSGKRIFFDRPIVWIFTNQVPDMSLLSKSRWRLWYIDPKNNLQKWNAVQLRLQHN